MCSNRIYRLHPCVHKMDRGYYLWYIQMDLHPIVSICYTIFRYFLKVFNVKPYIVSNCKFDKKIIRSGKKMCTNMQNLYRNITCFWVFVVITGYWKSENHFYLPSNRALSSILELRPRQFLSCYTRPPYSLYRSIRLFKRIDI